MREGYSNLAGELFAKAISVVGRYHFFVHINRALDKTRKEVREAFPDEKQWKHLRWALLKNPEKLTTEEATSLAAAFKLSVELAEVYRLRQNLKEFFAREMSKLEAAAELAR
jgi:transposase